ncbi:SNF1-related protein kinase regulatory subunit gamma-1 [Dendrobium catenatum]|uniref:SNF1-related protein kinase regulatory subunit gamma-1 n=1 Tax=Dendrobium catenatum TaxID=906689 RepID=A0A2I0WQM4_9ASPA|nr:SNF1-related protein kinase regulatory subunit gamma-1 [Dendrobium catenatum]
MDFSSISTILNDSTDGHKKEVIVLSPTSQFEDASCVCTSSRDSMASGSALQSFLDHISIDPITNFLNTSVLELKLDDCIQDAIRSLYERNVFGAPIVNSVSSDRGNFIDRDIGFIEFSSMVLWSLEEFDKASAESKSDSHGFLSMLEQISQIGQTKVGELAKFFLWEPFFPASPGDSLLRVLLLFSKHRRLKVVPVVESSNSCVVSFITQSSGLDWFDQIADMPISDFGFEKNRALVCIFGDQTVADALHILWENHFDAVPVIGRVTKTLIGFVRRSDIYLLLEDDELYQNRK